MPMNSEDWAHADANELLARGVIGFLPILNYGSPTTKIANILEVLQLKRVVCLTVTKSFSGSDVGGFQTSAEVVTEEDGRREEGLACR
ncbi:hypothetical protein M408DRAFT_135286 [Serendipita vermifera MAFF 305830]|uniref:Uncharacterized protein n=1 Tax=Serendipita vermifera MAFF 305830 TaxID=933852 RepID=A0A0C3AMJ2_SERVB|nr:hypothetical protein M408DRAFT_135286 [Serendipita vermifera MAFF 305830]